MATTAIAATVMTKFWEKTGEILSEKVFAKSEKFLDTLKEKSPTTATAIEKAPEQALDYGQAVIDVQALAERDFEIAEAARALAQAIKEESDARLASVTQEIVKALENRQPPSKIADKVGLIVQGGNVSIQNVNVD